MTMVYGQAWGLCVAYLVLGLVSELLRRGGLQIGSKAQAFLDSLPLTTMHYLGGIEIYLRALVSGVLNPFWNRMLLSSITLVVILVQATLTGLLILLFARTRARAR
jgi:hypothetical protein